MAPWPRYDAFCRRSPPDASFSAVCGDGPRRRVRGRARRDDLAAKLGYRWRFIRRFRARCTRALSPRHAPLSYRPADADDILFLMLMMGARRIIAVISTGDAMLVSRRFAHFDASMSFSAIRDFRHRHASLARHGACSATLSAGSRCGRLMPFAAPAFAAYISRRASACRSARLR